MKAAGLKQPTCVVRAHYRPAFAVETRPAKFYFFDLQTLFLNPW
jgi:hypothetical protein